ncbi:Barrel-sandwich domain of CusB or HlyD membrane-fusion [Robiginitalea myxolifaciens]|uniref:Barrel-sandwich domain of CusB or HlyD membrane-fusion n=1 Tax=Robiginitalea myxolifaciens TaxID=400055 RepID=A0A1I6HKR9_9FLAO|nr:efflux RND transporter periplasmic adaptor subunit [Robiginitalea myxolifaciens]SFR54937.1 Barrel-sandwich domain of CusB or HlyD membrane-fusion [Robiginitalea myxolifaciens]
MKFNRLARNLSAALLLATLGCAGEKEEQKELVRPVEYQKVSYANGAEQRTFSGTARTEKIINLSFRSSGILIQLDIRLGQVVKKGQLLGKLDNVESRLNYERSVTSLNSAESQMNTAKLSLDRIRVLYEKGSASLTDFESAKNSYRNAQQSYESAKRSVSIGQEQVNYGFLYAPEDGVITSVTAEVDENISPGQTIAVLNAGTEMEIALGLPESIINQVEVGMPVAITLSSLAEQEFQGTVTELSPAIDVNTATYPARVKLNKASEDVKTGMAANVTFAFAEDENHQRALRVPANSVGEDSSGRFVFLVVQEGDKATVKKNLVKVGNLNSSGFEIIEGLQEGQLIATAGLQTLLDGQEVSLQ